MCPLIASYRAESKDVKGPGLSGLTAPLVVVHWVRGGSGVRGKGKNMERQEYGEM